MSTIVKSLAIVVSAGLLSGCQSSPFLSGIFGSSKPATAQRAAPEVPGALMLEDGRAQLASGNISAAVAHFRMARMDPATAADANNGLGVAYARLGRPDLAEQYFTMALEMRPEDMRFSANLLRLRHSTMMARRDRAPQQLAAAARTAEIERQRIAANDARRSRPVIQIVTRGELGAAPSMTVSSAPSFADNAEALAETNTGIVVEAGAKGSDAPAPSVAAHGPRTIEVAFNN